jgi:TonB-dependent starch-binding outer membrane protein SusC
MNGLSAQKPGKSLRISGRVLDLYNSPVANAVITVDGNKTSSFTNSRGYYKIRVSSGNSTVGVLTSGIDLLKQDINGRTKINFNFSTLIAKQPDQNARDGEQEVQSGYGVVRKKNLTTDISNIDGTDKKYSSYSSISDMIERHVSGVRVYGNKVIIQGSQNMYGYVYPLIVVDGVYMEELPDIPPVTVKSIEVLKGTSATIYGSRAMGGAIIITTKLQN